MTSSIVCGVDHSGNASAAAHVAAALAARLGLPLRLVTALPVEAPPPATIGASAAVFDRGATRREAERSIARRLAEVLEDVGARDAASRVEDGAASERLRAVAEEEDAAFVVVGTRGDGPARAALLGSVSMATVQAAPCPVIVVPPAVSHEHRAPLAGAAIVCGVRGPEDRRVVHGAARLAGGLRLPLRLAHVIEPDQRGESEPAESRALLAPLVVAAEKIAPQVEATALLTGDPAQQLRALADELPAALLVVGTRGRGPLRAAVMGSVSRSLACSAGVPVLISSPRSALPMGSAPHGGVAPAA